ncbi:hypothetical protein SSX86_025741 [Deinandra increscens subsp. villosa]|uniref:GTD-binding domain-containing protein n=1 Tax=Deinandra increscens subsp. villosa TaxID=3103831 RepID=A0AAP0CIA9_9ASTR
MVATKGIMDYLLMATCEWFLMFWMFIEAALAYSLTRFAKYCQIQIPCLLCSRLDHFFGNEEPGSYSYLHLFCRKHQTDISYWIYCNLHNELVDIREMCEDCSNSASLQTRPNLEGYRFVGGQMGNQRSYFNCSCCKRQWKEKPSNQQPIWSNVVGSRASKATTKPPLPRVARHGRSKRSKNKVRHRHRNEPSPVGPYPGVKFTSDSEFEIIFSDNDDGGFKVVGIGERSLKNDTSGGVIPYRILGRHSHSTPDLRNALLLEAQLNESSRTRTRTRSASMTPNCLIRCNLAELNRKPEEFDPLRIGKDKNRSSFMNPKTRRSLDGSAFSCSNNGSQNRYNVFSRNSFSASDLGSERLVEMHGNNTLRQRSASLTPNNSSGHGLGEYQWLKNAPPRVKKHKKLPQGNVRSGYGYLDDSAVSHKMGNRHNRNTIPRRHSYSVFQLGGQILLNMPTDESQNGSISCGFEEYKRSNMHSPEPDFLNMMQFQRKNEDFIPLQPYSLITGDLPFAFIDRSKGYGTFDDSAVIRNTGIRYQNSTPRRHSHSFFDFGREILLNMPINESLTNNSASFAPGGSIGYGLEQPNNFQFQTMTNRSVDSVQPPRRRNRRDKKSFSSSNRTSGYESMDDLVGSFNTGVQDRNKDPRRHSYSAFELGCALLLNGQPIEKNSIPRSASVTRNVAINHGFGEPKRPGSQKRRNSSPSTMILNKNQGYGFLDDSVVSFNTGIYDRTNDPRRHSYSAFELGCALLLNGQPIDTNLTPRSASVTHNAAINHGLGESKRPEFQTRGDYSSSNMVFNKNQGYGFLDDSVVSFNTGIYDRKNDPRRHSYSAFELGCALLLNDQPIETFITPRSESVARNVAINHGFGEPKRPGFQTRGDSSPLTMFFNKNQGYGFLDDSVVSFNTGIYDRNNDPRRHSYSAFELGCAILLNEQPIDTFLTPRSASVERNVINHGFGEPKRPEFQTRGNSSPSTMFFNKNQGYGFLDDSVVSFNTGIYDRNNDPRRHSYSAFELGCALLLNGQPIDKSLTNNSASMTQNSAIDHGFAEPDKSGFQTRHTPSNSIMFLNKNQGYGFLDDSVVTHSTGIDHHNHSHNQKKIPRRHSYSILQLGGDIILNMPTDGSSTSHSFSLPRNNSIGQSLGDLQNSNFQNIEKDNRSLPPTSSLKLFSPSYEVRNDILIDKTKWHGSFDDYLISRSMGSQSNIPRRHSHSAFDLGRALLLEISRDASLAPSGSSGHGYEEHNRAHHHQHHHKAKRHKNHLPPPIPSGSLSDCRNDLFTVSLDKTHGVRSLDDSVFSNKTGNHNQSLNSNPRRHSYSAFELGCAVLLNMQRDSSLTRRSASVTPKIQTVKQGQHLNFKKDEQPVAFVNIMGSDLSSTSLHKPHGYESFDDSIVSNGRDSRKRYKNLTRNYYSVSDLTSPVILQMNFDEGLTRKSESFIPDYSIGQALEEMNSLKFQSGASSSLQKHKKSGRSKAKRSKHSRARRSKKPLRTTNKVKSTNSSTNAASDASYESFDDSDAYESFDDSDTNEFTTDSQNRHNIFSRNSQSASNLGSVVLLEMQPDDRSRNRSKSLTPNCSYFGDSLDAVQFLIKKSEEKYPMEVEKDRKRLPMNPAKEMDSSSTRADLCPTCSDKFDMRSLDGSIASEIDYDGGIEKVKRKAEDDVRCMRLLQSELEAERNAATVAANHAMNMITRLQQEKAALQMEALQYLRMMEEQAEYDMEALQKANELVEEKENEIQDLLNELDQYRSKYGDDLMDNIKTFDDEKSYILNSLSALEKKIYQLSNGVHDQSQENEKYADLSKLEQDILDMKEKMEALQSDIDFIKHACNTLHGNEGLEFIQEIAHQLQDLRRIMFDRRLISSN